MSLTVNDKKDIYYYLKLTRAFENWIAMICQNQSPQNPVIIGKGYLSTGQEAISVGATYALEKEDWLAPSHRDIGGHLIRGLTIQELLLQYRSKKGSPTKGRDGNVHFGLKKYNTVGFISQMGAMTAPALGVAFGMVYQKKPNAVLCFFGDGASSQGVVHESMNYAAVFKLPLVFIINNNRWAISTPVKDQCIIENLAERGAAYGIPATICEGNNVFAVYNEASQALMRARRGEGPQLIECKSMRMAGHGTHDMAKYVPEEEYEFWRKKDPIEWAEKILKEEGIADEKYFKEVEEKIKSTLDQEIAKAMQAEDVNFENELNEVFAP